MLLGRGVIENLEVAVRTRELLEPIRSEVTTLPPAGERHVPEKFGTACGAHAREDYRVRFGQPHHPLRLLCRPLLFGNLHVTRVQAGLHRPKCL